MRSNMASNDKQGLQIAHVWTDENPPQAGSVHLLMLI